jgi:pilus assembly protein Flp/PilA
VESTAELLRTLTGVKQMTLRSEQRKPAGRRRGSVIVEYILLLTLVGLGSIVGLAAVRDALVNKLVTVAEGIEEQPDSDVHPTNHEGISVFGG